MSETAESVALRRAVGFLCLICLVAGFALVIITMATQSESVVGVFVFLVGALGPLLGMIVHLNLTGVLSRAAKATWRRQLWSNPRSLFAAFTYLLSRDLQKATEELGAGRR